MLHFKAKRLVAPEPSAQLQANQHSANNQSLRPHAARIADESQALSRVVPFACLA